MESDILFTLQFDIQLTSAYRFLERYSKIAKATTVEFHMSVYFLELSLLDSKMNQYKPSMQAAAALYISMRTM